MTEFNKKELKWWRSLSKEQQDKYITEGIDGCGITVDLEINFMEGRRVKERHQFLGMCQLSPDEKENGGSEIYTDLKITEITRYAVVFNVSLNNYTETKIVTLKPKQKVIIGDYQIKFLAVHYGRYLEL